MHTQTSRIRATNKPRSNEYYNALINTTLYDPRLGSKESHEARKQARLAVLHSESNTKIRQEAAKDLRLHGQSLTRRTAKALCVCPSDWLICLCK